MQSRLLRILTVLLTLLICDLPTPSRSGPFAISAALAQIPNVPPSRSKDCEHGERMIYLGFALIVIGFLLTPIGIGIPILIVGKAMVALGIVVYLWQKAVC